jgi:glyoxalase family protein
MQAPTSGLHHVTAIAGDPQRNLDFYAGVLGLRLVKRTVNFDDPGTYHFYYGDRTGRPGTLLTFFPWPGARPGRHGVGEATVTSFSVPGSALGYWEDRLGDHGVTGLARRERFGAETLRFADPDGLGLELVADPEEAGDPWISGAIPGSAAIRRLYATTVELRTSDATAALLQEVLGMRAAGDDGGVRRFESDSEGGVIDLVPNPGGPGGTMGAGSVHHIAWRAADGVHQARLRGAVIDFGLGVTPVVDRQYFRSIYFREPGGVLFEVATDQPGFLIDEPEATLGEALKLPPQYEAARDRIEADLPDIVAPTR